MKVIMLVGHIRAGKDTVAEIIEDLLMAWSVLQLSFSDSIGDVLKIYGLELTREHMTEFATALKSTRYGQPIFRRAVIKRISESMASFTLLCGARFVEDAEVLKEYEGCIVAIHASAKTRYERARRSSKDGNLTFEQFLEADGAPTEGSIDALMARANVVIENDGDDPDELRRKVLAAMAQIVGREIAEGLS